MKASYRVLVTAGAERELRNLPERERRRVTAGMLALADNPRPPGCQKLSGMEGYRLRVGRYRILYVVDDAPRTVTIYEIGHRREVYR